MLQPDLALLVEREIRQVRRGDPYKEGNLRAAERHRVVVEALRDFGIAEERCRFDHVSAGEGEKFARITADMVESLRRLGPLAAAAAWEPVATA